MSEALQQHLQRMIDDGIVVGYEAVGSQDSIKRKLSKNILHFHRYI